MLESRSPSTNGFVLGWDSNLQKLKMLSTLVFSKYKEKNLLVSIKTEDNLISVMFKIKEKHRYEQGARPTNNIKSSKEETLIRT